MKKTHLAILIIITLFLFSYSIKTFTVDNELLKISKEYRDYNLYNSQNYWTYSFCEPMVSPPYYADTFHVSRPSVKKSPHGNKLYKFYVKDLEAYDQKLNPQPEGQVVIKEVWNVRVVDRFNDSVQNGLMNAKMSPNDGMFYVPTTRKQLFIMYKSKPTQENDQGWWYGIVDIEQGVEKATVIESMKINRCVKCHMDAKGDRIIGLDGG